MDARMAETLLEIILQYLPNLFVGRGAARGASGANIVYKGEMKPWGAFVQEVIDFHHRFDWNQLGDMGLEMLESEAYCENSKSVCNRLQQRIGHIMSAFCNNANLTLYLGTLTVFVPRVERFHVLSASPS